MDRDEAWRFLVKIYLKITCAKRVSWGGRSSGSSHVSGSERAGLSLGWDRHHPTAGSMHQAVKILNRR